MSTRKPPVEFSPELFSLICERLSLGETLTSICKQDGMPTPRAVQLWAAADEGRGSQFARARADGFDALASDTLDIADSSTPDDAQCAKLRVDTRLKLLAKWDPKRYGDRMQIDADVTVETLSDADLDAKLAKLQAVVGGLIGGKGEAAE
jgi:hypothetical protein